MHLKKPLLAVAGGLLLAVTAICPQAPAAGLPASPPTLSRAAHNTMMALAVLGDSDSESYRDLPERGGRYHHRTLQWTEILARLRGHQIDPGEWGGWGTPGRIAALQHWLGLPVRGRVPRKHDYRYNFAISGAGCEELMGGTSRQAQQLVALMDEDPARWRSGVVVIRIGVNSFGKAQGLDQLAQDPAAPPVMAAISRCVQQIQAAVALIHAHHAATRVVLVGIFDNTHWARYLDRWQAARSLKNIHDGLDVFDNALRRFVANDPRLAFFDDRAWFASRWGGRAADGRPAYRSLSVAPGLVVSNTVGDELQHAVIADGHAGVVWNALWAQSLVSLMNRQLGLPVQPIGDDEVAALLHALEAPGPASR